MVGALDLLRHKHTPPCAMVAAASKGGRDECPASGHGSDPAHSDQCIHGRPTYVELKQKDIERLFGRRRWWPMRAFEKVNESLSTRAICSCNVLLNKEGTIMRSRILGLVCFALFSALPVAADELDNALHLYNAGRYNEAIALLTPLAKSGTLDAQLVLSNVYNFGQGVPVDQAEAYRWLALAAEQDSPGALYNLGVMTLNGDGTESDPQEGMRLIYRAAELGNAEAHFRLGVSSMQRVAETGDLDTGLGHLAIAGQLGHRGASAFLGVLLQDIPEVEHHLVKSALNLQVAIARGCSDLDDTAAQVIAQLSSSERALYEQSLSANLIAGEMNAGGTAQERAPCLPWMASAL